MATALLLGATGMVGSQILSTLLTAHPHLTSISTISRRPPPSPPSSSSVSLDPLISSDTSTYTTLLPTSPPPTILFSSLATTRASAGSFAAQYALEHDLNISLASTARKSGTKIYVLISAHGASTTSVFPYTKMKGEIERDILALDFEHTIIVRPGLIAGRREETRYAEAVVRGIAAVVGRVSNSLKDFWAQDCDVIAKAAVGEALRVLREGGEKVVYVEQGDIVRVGRDGWKGL